MSEPIPNGSQSIEQIPKAKSRSARRLLPFGVALAIAISFLVTNQSKPSDTKDIFGVSGSQTTGSNSKAEEPIQGEEKIIIPPSLPFFTGLNTSGFTNTGVTPPGLLANGNQLSGINFTGMGQFTSGNRFKEPNKTTIKAKTISGTTKLDAYYETRQTKDSKTHLYRRSAGTSSPSTLPPAGTSSPSNIILVSSGKVKGKLTIENVDSIIASTKDWNTNISAPVLITKGDGLAKIGEPGLESIKKVIQTMKVGSTDAELVPNNGSFFQVSFQVSSGEAGDKLVVYRSQDGKLRAENTPDQSCILDNEKYCNFRTDHLTYFTVGSPATITGTFVINNDQDITTGLSVTLNMNVSGDTLMKFGNTPAERDAASWVAYNSSYSFTLSGSDRGTKTVYAAFANGTDTGYVSDSIIFNWDNDNFLDDRFRALNPTTGQIIWALYGDGSGGVDRTAYTSYWSTMQCETGNINFQYINPGTDTIPQNLSSNTIYLLNSGTYTTSRQISSTGSCVTILGSGRVNLYSNSGIYAYFYITTVSAKYNILDNLRIDGYNNGVGGTHATRNNMGIGFVGTDSPNFTTNHTVNNIEIFNNIQSTTANYEGGIKVTYGSYIHMNDIVSYNNNVGIMLYLLATNIKTTNVRIFNNYSNGIEIWHASSYITVDGGDIFGNGGGGIYFNTNSNSWYSKMNNLNIYNNAGGGIITYVNGDCSYCTINNSSIYNNSNFGIYIAYGWVSANSTYTINNSKIFNNIYGVGGGLRNLNNTEIFNNLYGIYSTATFNTYGNNKIFNNTVNNYNSTRTTGGAVPSLNRSTGSFDTTQRNSFNCDYTNNASNGSGQFVNDLNYGCDIIGRNSNWLGNINNKNIYTLKTTRQIKPVEYNGSNVLIPSTTLQYNTGKYVAESNRVPYATIKFEPDSGYTTGTSVQLKLQSTDVISYTITGDIQEGTINGTVSDSGILNATLTNGNGVKYIYTIFSTGGFTQQQVFAKIKLTDTATMNTEKALISGYFGSGTEYTKYRSINQCNPEKFLIQELNPGVGTIPQNNLEINTVYLLNSGSYITTGQINLNGSCIGLIGSGKVNLTSNAAVSSLIYMTPRRNNIINNIKIDGQYIASYGVNLGSYSTNMNVSNAGVQRTTYGIILSAATYYHVLDKNKIFNVGNGVWIDGLFHKILNSDIYNFNGEGGLYFQPNSPGYIVVNNIKMFNGSLRGIRGGNANNSTFNNIQLFNIGLGSFSNFSYTYLVNNGAFYNSNIGFNWSNGANVNNMNIYNNITSIDSSEYIGYGKNKVFNNIGGSSITKSFTALPTVGWATGTVENGNLRMSCERATTALYAGQYYFDLNGDCGDRLSKTRTVSDGSTQYLYGPNMQKQVQPVYYNNYGQLLTGDFGYDPTKFIGEREPRLAFGVVHLVPNSGTTADPNIQVELVVTDPMNYSITGDIQTFVSGSVSGSGIVNLALTNFTGTKLIYVTFSTGSRIEPTQSKAIELTKNPRDILVDKYLCANSRHNDRWTFNQCCMGGITVEELNPGQGTIPTTLRKDTIYILNSGDYISPNTISFGGDCTAIVGSGEVTLYSSGQLRSSIYGNGRENLIIDNIKVDGYNDGTGGAHAANTNGITMNGVYDNSTLNNVQSYNNGIGYYNASAYYTLVNNSDFYNNSSYGIQLAGGSAATVNNSKMFNNANGISFYNTNGSLTNSIISNNNIGIIDDSSRGSNLYDNTLIANNTTVLSVPNYGGYGRVIPTFSKIKMVNNFNADITRATYYNTITFQNNINTTTNGTVGGVVSSLGWTTGNISKSTIPFSTQQLITPQNTLGAQLQNINSTYDTIGYIASNPLKKNNKIGLGSSLTKQVYPIFLSNGSWTTGNFETDTTKYIGENINSIGQGTIIFEPNVGYTSSNSVDIKVKASYPMTVTITGDFIESPTTLNIATQTITGITLTSSTGVKYIYAIFSTGGYTQSVIRDKIKYVDTTTKTNEQNFILARFDSGTYTENRSFNGCDTGDIVIQELNPGIGTLSQNGLEKNTVYLLNSGSYITTGQINFNSSCIGLIGSGDVRLYSTVAITNMLYVENRRNIIIENIKIDGYNNGQGGVHATKNTNGIQLYNLASNNTISQTQSYLNNSNGILITSNANNNTIQQSQAFNNTVYGIQFGYYSNKTFINNTKSFGNQVGIYPYYWTTNSTINNSQIYNNSQYGINFYPYGSSPEGHFAGTLLSNTEIYNNSSYGIYHNWYGAFNTKINNLSIHNNGGGIYYGASPIKNYGTNKFFNNGTNINGDLGPTLSTGSASDFPSLGRATGSIETPSYTMSCDRFSNPINQLTSLGYVTNGVFLSNPFGQCTTKGILSWNGPITNTYYGKNTPLQIRPVIYNSSNILSPSNYNYNTGQYIAEYNILPDFAVYDVTGGTLGDVTASLNNINLGRFSILNNSGSTGYTFSQNGIFDWIYLDNVLNTTGTIRAQVNRIYGSDLVISKTGFYPNGQTGVYGGDMITYRLNYSNSGFKSVDNVTIQDILLTGLEFISSDPMLISSGLDASGNKILTWNIASMSGYASGSIVFTAQVVKTFGNSNNITIPSTGLRLRVDASSITGLNDGDPITTRTDKSLNGNNLVQNTVGAKPLYKKYVSEFNGKSAIDFITTQSISNATLNLSTSPFSVFYVARMKGGGNSRVLQGYNNWLLGYHGGLEDRAYFEGWVSSSGPAASTGLKLYEAIGDRTISSVWSNGTLLAANGGGINGPNGVSINGGVGEPSNAQVAEIIIYNRALSYGERISIENYLNAKYFGSGAYSLGNGSLANTATIDYSGSDLNTGNNASTVQTTYTVQSDVRIGVITSKTIYTIGEQVPFTINIGNSGRDASSGNTVTLNRGSGLNFVSTNFTGSYNASSRVFTFNTVDLIKDQMTGLILTAVVLPGAASANLYFTGNISGPNLDLTTGNNTATGYIYINYPPTSPILLSPANGSGMSTGTVFFSWSGSTDSDGISGYTLQLSGTSNVYNYTVAGTGIILQSIPDGTYTWKVKAVDNIGSESNRSTAQTITIDTISPTTLFTGITATYPIYSTGNTITGLVDITENNLSKFIWTWNGGNTVIDLSLANENYTDTGLLLAMNFDNLSSLGETTGGIVKDLSTYNNTGTDYGATWISSGKFNGAYNFNGSNNYIDIPNSAIFDIQKITISSRVYSTNFSQYGFIFEKGPVNTQYSLFFEGGSLCFRTINSAGSLSSLYTNLATLGITNNTWYHIVATYDGSYKRIFVNGVEKSNTPYTETLRTAQVGERIGAYGAPGGYFYSGMIDNLRVYNKALSSGEIYQLYTGTSTQVNTNLPQYATGKYLFSKSYAGLIDGSYTFQGCSTDIANNTGCTVNKTIIVDTKAPTIQLLSPTNNSGIKNQLVTFSRSGSDGTGSGISGYIFQLFSGGSTILSTGLNTGTNLPVSGLNNQTYAWKVQATDKAGNISISSIGTFTIDTINPIVLFTGVTATYSNYTTGNIFTGLVNITENNLSKFIWTWNGINYSLYDSGLVLMMNFDNISSLGENATTVKDLSTYNNTGSIVGGVAWTANGRFAGSYNFNGSTNNHIDFGNNSNLRLNSFTIVSRINPTSTSSYRSIFSYIDNFNSGRYGYIFLVRDGNLAWLLADSNSYVEQYGITPISTNVRTFVAISFDGSSVKSYKNNYLIQNYSTSKNIVFNSGNKAFIGKTDNVNSFNDFAGQIDDVRIYNRALSSGEISQLYNSNLSKYDIGKRLFQTNYSGLADGSYTYQACTTDLANNTGCTNTKTTIIDTISPITHLLSPSDGTSYNGSNISLLWSGNDGSGAGISGYNYQIATDTGFTSLVKNGTTTSTGYTTKLSNGTYYRHIRGYDKAGNYAVYTPYQSFSVSSGSSDIDDPVVEAIYPTNLAYFETGSLSISRSGNDGTGSGISGYIYQVSSDSNFSTIVKSGSRTTTGVSVVGLTNGTYYRHVKAVDNTNNESFYTDTISFKIFDIEAFLVASSYTKIATNIFAGADTIDVGVINNGLGVSKTTKQLVMKDTGALPIEVIIPRNTYFKNDSLEDYTGTLNNPSYIDINTINGFDTGSIIQAVSIGDETQSVSFANQSGADVNAIIKIPTPGRTVGEEASVYYSNDNSNWIKHVDTTVRLINNEPYVQFYSPHFTDFIITYASGQIVGCDGGGANGESCVVLSVSAGDIFYGAPLSGLDFGMIASSTTTQEISGKFDGTGIYENFFRVQDLKGEDLGWYTSVESTILQGQGSASGFSIPASNVQIASDTGVTFFEGLPNDTYVGIDNNYTPLDDMVTYMQRDDLPNFLKANLYGHQPRIKVIIPGFTKPGQYHAQIVLTMYDRS